MSTNHYGRIIAMQIVIPMAGTGERFLKSGYTLPKPLILIEGKPMIAYVTQLFPPDSDFLYICNTKHMKETPMASILRKISPKATIAEIRYKKKGPVYGILQAEAYIADDEPVVVSYCDFSTIWDVSAFTAFVTKHDLDGCIVCYSGFHPHLLGNNLYASVKRNEKNDFIEIREKYSFTPNKMDSWQSCGMYYFKTGAMLKKYCKKLVAQKIMCNNEYYVSLLYNLMHADTLKIKVFPIDYFCQWGTPEDLEEYLYTRKYFA